jgi:hypothetical protein
MVVAGLGLAVDPAQRAQEPSLIVRRVHGEELVDEGSHPCARRTRHDALGQRDERLHLVRVQEDRLRAGQARARVGGGHAVGVGQVIADGMILGNGGQRQPGSGRAHQALQHLAPPHPCFLGHARPRRWSRTVAPRRGRRQDPETRSV